MQQGVEAFCRRTYPQLVGALTIFCGHRGVAEELAQETLVRVWDRWERVAGLDNPEGWAHHVAFNLARSWGRRKQAERRANARWARSTGSGDGRDVGQDTVDTLVVRAALAQLPDRQRAVLAWRYYAGLSVAETAQVLGCRPGTVKSLTHTAVARLRADHGALLERFEEVGGGR